MIAVRAQDGAVVVFNVIGGIADMSLFEDVFEREGRTPAAWQAFFARVSDAKVIEEHRDLVRLVSDLGYATTYSSTFPAMTHADTVQWLAVHDFPAGELLCRPSDDLSRAYQIKQRHCRSIPDRKQRLRAFVDNDPQAARFLRARSVLGFTFDFLLGLRVGELRETLEHRRT